MFSGGWGGNGSPLPKDADDTGSEAGGGGGSVASLRALNLSLICDPYLSAAMLTCHVMPFSFPVWTNQISPPQAPNWNAAY